MRPNLLLPLLILCACLSTTLQAQTQLVINEYSAANWKQFPDNYLENEDWVEIYNPGDSAVALAGWGLTDNPNTLGKWKFKGAASIAGKNFVRVWCSGRDTAVSTHFHSNFKLTQTKGTPEKLTLTTPSGQIVDQIEVKKTERLQSRARVTDGAPDWKICTAPTPRGPNSGPMFQRFVNRPAFDKAGGFYADSVQITITTDEPGGVIRFTTDGTYPGGSFAKTYGGPVKMSKTTVLKAMVYSPDSTVLPSFVQFHTYFINVNHTLEVVSIAADQLLTLANGDNTLEPIGSMEYFGKNKQLIDRVYGELNSHGQDSWANDQRSLDWITRDEFGYKDVVDAQIYKGSARDKFQRVIFRASGDDNYPAANRPDNEGCAHMRDDYVQTLAHLAQLNLDTRKSERCIIYLNGEYWGVYSFREKIDDHDYMGEYYNQGKFDIQMVLTWGNTWSEYGGAKSISDWKALRTYILSTNNNMADSAKYAYVESQMDVLSLIDYFYVNQSSVCSDWLNYNTGWWRGLDPAGTHKKWGYILWDNDATFGFYINYTGVPDTSPYAAPCDIDDFDTQFGSPDPERHIQILKRLRNNPKFNQLYLSRHADLRNGVYSCANQLHVLDSMVAVIEPEMAMHADRWSGTYAGWQQNVLRLRDFIQRRCDYAADAMMECDSITGPYDIHFRSEPVGKGAIKVNTTAANGGAFTSEYFGVMKNVLQAIPAPNSGYVFSHWQADSTLFTSDSAQMLVNATFMANDTVIAVFKPFVLAVDETDIATDGIIKLNVTPTLFTDQINLKVEMTDAAPVAVSLFSATGRLAYTTALAKTNLVNQQIQFPVSLPEGVYFIQVQAGEHLRTVKLVKI
jgi:CotH kinase protein/Lamin Tail Domain/Chitobiase/beta-hexosaminidase C-terminal domain